MNKFVLSIFLFINLSVFVGGQALGSSNYALFMYRNEDVQCPTSLFSLKDKIVVRNKLKNLPKGNYTFHADWYNAFGRLQDTCRHEFTAPQEILKVIDSQLEIRKASPLKKLFSASESTGYNIKFYGKWQVKLYLNGEEIACKEFEVQ